MKHLVSIPAAALLAASIAGAASIPVLNFSFETPAQVDGGFTSGSIPNWTGASSGGVFNPTTTQLSPPTDGVQVGYINANFGTPLTISQLLSAILTVDTTYTLQVDFLARKDCCLPWGGSEIDLVAGSTVLASSTTASGALAAGAIQTSTVTFTALSGDPHLGQTLEIRIIDLGQVSTGQGQIDFDNVRLDASGAVSTAPEPGSLALTVSVAALGVLFRRRAFRKSL